MNAKMIRPWLLGAMSLCWTWGTAPAEEYRGHFAPKADYILSGQRDRELPPSPPVKVDFIGNGCRIDRLSDVPAASVHPRVVLSGSDIEQLRGKAKDGARADATFRYVFKHLQTLAAIPGPERPDFGNAPWRGLGSIGAKGLVALITEDRALGRDAVEWTVKHARFLEPRIDLLNSDPQSAGWRENFYYWARTGVRVGGLSYIDAFQQGGAARVAELAAKGVKFSIEDNQWSYTSLASEYDYAYAFNRLRGPLAAGSIQLEPGLHAILLRIGLGKADLEMRAPGRDRFEPVDGADLLRPRQARPVPPDPRLVAQVGFEDLSDQGRTTVGGPAGTIGQVLFTTLADAGVAGKGLKLRDEKAKLELSDIRMLDDAATVALWIKRDRITDGYVLTAPGKFSLRLRGKTFWGAYERSPDVLKADGGDAVQPGKWFHVVASFGDEINLYVNGRCLDSVQVDRSAITHGANARAEQLILNGSMPSVVDDLRVYNRVLSAENVRQLYEQSIPEKP